MAEYISSDSTSLSPAQIVRKWDATGDRTAVRDSKGAGRAVHSVEEADSTGGELLLEGWRFRRIDYSGAEHARTSSARERWSAERDPVDAASEDRIRLLAKKFEAELDREEMARLAILTARLDRLVPHVTEQDVAHLESTVASVDRINSELERIATKYALPR